MLGTALVAELCRQCACVALCRSQPVGRNATWVPVDLLAEESIAPGLAQHSPDVIIHTAALTDVDACERTPVAAYALHAGTTEILASYCRRTNAKLVYVSTDAVFDGQKSGSYAEGDAPNPLQVYGRSKRAGEDAALSSPRALILRTNVFGWRPHRHDSFAEWVLSSLREQRELTMFEDVVFSPIATKLFAGIVARSIDADLRGVYHAGGGEVISKCDFAYRVASAYGLATSSVKPIRLADKPLAARRARNMALNSVRLSMALGIALPDVDGSISAWKETESDMVGA